MYSLSFFFCIRNLVNPKDPSRRLQQSWVMQTPTLECRVKFNSCTKFWTYCKNPDTFKERGPFSELQPCHGGETIEVSHLSSRSCGSNWRRKSLSENSMQLNLYLGQEIVEYSHYPVLMNGENTGIKWLMALC